MIKKIIFILLAAVTVFAVSCSDPDNNQTPPDDIQGGTEQNGAELDPDPTSPYSTQDLKAFMAEKYNAAREAYFWFAVSGMPADEAVDMNNIQQVGDHYYYKVGHETIKTLADLENYLKTIFSDKLTEGLLKMYPDNYIDIDGELWAADASRGTNILVGDVIFSISEKSDSKIVYNAYVEMLSDDMEIVESIETYTYNYEKTENGWRWTKFSIFE